MPTPRRMKPKRVNKASIAETIEVKESLMERIEGELSEDGIELFSNDNVEPDYLQLPADITSEDSRELGRHFNAFTQQKMWARTLIGRVSNELRENDIETKRLQYEIYGSLPSKMSIKEKDVHVRDDDRARETMKRHDVLVEKHLVLSNYIASIEDAIFNLSREITRRGNDFNESKREGNIDNRRRV